MAQVFRCRGCGEIDSMLGSAVQPVVYRLRVGEDKAEFGAVSRIEEPVASNEDYFSCGHCGEGDYEVEAVAELIEVPGGCDTAGCIQLSPEAHQNCVQCGKRIHQGTVVAFIGAGEMAYSEAGERFGAPESVDYGTGVFCETECLIRYLAEIHGFEWD